MAASTESKAYCVRAKISAILLSLCFPHCHSNSLPSMWHPCSSEEAGTQQRPPGCEPQASLPFKGPLLEASPNSFSFHLRGQNWYPVTHPAKHAGKRSL